MPSPPTMSRSSTLLAGVLAPSSGPPGGPSEHQTEDRINAILSEAHAAMQAKNNSEKVRMLLNVTMFYFMPNQGLTVYISYLYSSLSWSFLAYPGVPGV